MCAQRVCVPHKPTLADSAAMEPLWAENEPLKPNQAHAKPGAITPESD